MEYGKFTLKVNEPGKIYIGNKMIRCPLEKEITEFDIETVKTSLRSQHIKDFTITPINKKAWDLVKKKMSLNQTILS